jgi:hypothetical protein
VARGKRGSGSTVGGFLAGAVAVLVGGGLAFVTALGVVNVTSTSASQPETSVVDYGTTE